MARCTLRTVATLFLTTLIAWPALARQADLKVMVWTWSPECTCSPEVAGDLDRAVEEVAAEVGLAVDLASGPRGSYMDRLTAELLGETPPDILWVDAALADALVSTDVLIPLDEALMRMPWLVADLSDEVLDRFSHDGVPFAIPLAGDGEPSRTGWALSRWVVDRGRFELALELLSRLRERVPVRGRPDLAVTEFRVEAERPVEGEEARLVARVANLGDEPTEVGSLSFMADDEPLEERVLDRLEPGQSVEVEMALPLPPAGFHDFAAATDHGHQLEENNELNNLGQFGHWISAQGAGSLPPSPSKLKGPFQVMGPVTHEAGLWSRGVKVAFDGTNYLVVYRRQVPLLTKGAPYRLYGTRVSQSGTVLDPGGFQITAATGTYSHFNLDCSGSNCLVVWMKDLRGATGSPLPDPSSVIAAARVSKAGAVIDTTPIVIANTPCPSCLSGYSVQRYDAPDVAFTGGDYMVVYRKGIDGGCQFQQSVLARLVTQSGSVKPGTWTVHTYQGQQEAVNIQRLAFNPAQKEGFLIFDTTDYSTTPYTLKVVGRWIKIASTGITSSTLRTIAQSPSSASWYRYGFSDVAADGKGNSYGVFESSVNTLSPYGSDVHGVRLGSSATQQIASKPKLVTGQMERPAVAWDGTMWTVVYAHGSGCSAWVGGFRVDAAGVAGPTIYDQNTSAAKVTDLDLIFGPVNGLVVFTNWEADASSPTGYVLTIGADLIDKAK